jgi:hypothetical protein
MVTHRDAIVDHQTFIAVKSFPGAAWLATRIEPRAKAASSSGMAEASP